MVVLQRQSRTGTHSCWQMVFRQLASISGMFALACICGVSAACVTPNPGKRYLEETDRLMDAKNWDAAVESAGRAITESGIYRDRFEPGTAYLEATQQMAWAHVYRATIFHGLGKRKESITDLDAAIKLYEEICRNTFMDDTNYGPGGGIRRLMCDQANQNSSKRLQWLSEIR